MIKVSIIGADHPMAGELARILIHHPETEIKSLFARELNGRSVSSVHHGFIGESPLIFSDKINAVDSDIFIIINDEDLGEEERNLIENLENIKIISLPSKDFSVESTANYETGISEINRKTLVRNAKKVLIPHGSIVTTLVALMPLAKFLLLNSDLDIEISLPADLIKDVNTTEAVKYIKNKLQATQSSFSGEIKLRLTPDSLSERGSKTKIEFKSKLPLEEVERIFEEIYDDHNFSFLSRNPSDTKEVEGTQKIILNFSKPDEETLRVEAVADARMRGGAGDIVHVMNLLFGLYEKTGLNLKPSHW